MLLLMMLGMIVIDNPEDVPSLTKVTEAQTPAIEEAKPAPEGKEDAQ